MAYAMLIRSIMSQHRSQECTNAPHAYERMKDLTLMTASATAFRVAAVRQALGNHVMWTSGMMALLESKRWVVVDTQ